MFYDWEISAVVKEANIKLLKVTVPFERALSS